MTTRAQTAESTNLPAVIGSYAVMQAGSAIAETVAANVGTGGISPFDLDRVRVPAGGATTWQIPSLEGDMEIKEVAGVIVAWRSPRAYWRESFDETGGGTPPDCASDDGITGMGEPGGDCALCPLARFGTAIKGRGQACRQMRLLFFLREQDRLPIVIVVPPSSLKAIGKYFLRLAGAELRYHAVVTRLALKKTANKSGIQYAEIVPSMDARLSREEMERIATYAQGLAPIFASVRVEESDARDEGEAA